MSHTKGKWEISSYRSGEIWVGADYHIATCHKSSTSPETMEANARLIAAAPETAKQRDDLLAACELLLKTLLKAGYDPEIEEAVTLAKAAIASVQKAEVKG